MPRRTSPLPRRPTSSCGFRPTGAYVSVLRTTTAGLAARLDFTVDDIEDLRMAVGEASALVLPEADPGADLTCRFYMAPGALTVTVSACRRRTARGADTTASPGRCSRTLATDAASADRRGVRAFTVRLTSRVSDVRVPAPEMTSETTEDDGSGTDRAGVSSSRAGAAPSCSSCCATAPRPRPAG